LPLAVRSAREDAINEVEFQILLSACDSLLDHIVVRLPYYMGMRVGEVQHLKPSWLDWENGILHIPPRQVCSPPCYECRMWRRGIWTPKSISGSRDLIIVPEVAGYLAQLGDKGVNRSRQSLELRFQRIRDRSGLARVCYMHALRASYATRLAEAGVSSIALCYIMGWASLESSEAYVQARRKQAHSELKEKVLNV
jgi:integrase